VGGAHDKMVKITQKLIEESARNFRDNNPLHYGEDAIACGMLPLSMVISKVAGDNPNHVLTYLHTWFRKPINIGDDIKVAYINDDGHIHANITNQKREVVVEIVGRIMLWKK